MTTPSPNAPNAPTGTKICAHNLTPVRDPKRCSRCKSTYYADADAQRAHWPLHKQVCVDSASSASALERVGKYSCAEAFRELQTTLRAVVTLSDGIAPALMAPLLRRVKETLDEDEDATIEMQFHTFGRQFGLFPADVERSINLFWACPGMADCLIGDDLLTPSGRKFRRAHPHGLPSGKSKLLTARDRAEFSFFERTRNMFDTDEYGALTSAERKVHKYSFGLAHILTGTAIHTTPTNYSMNDGLGTFRTCHASFVSRVKLLVLWSDPIVRSICGAGIACGPALAYSVVHDAVGKSWDFGDVVVADEELVSPGIAIDSLLRALLYEIRQVENGIERAIDCIELLTTQMMRALNLGEVPKTPSGASGKTGWPAKRREADFDVVEHTPIVRAFKAIGLERRATLALMFADNKFDALADKVAYRHLKPWETRVDCADANATLLRAFMSCVVTLCCVSSGLSKEGQRDCARVMDAAARGKWWLTDNLLPPADGAKPRPLCAAGKRFSGRAAFFWLLRRCDLYEHAGKTNPFSQGDARVMTDLLDVTPIMRDIPRHLMEWYAAKWPRQKLHTEDDVERADEKLLCLDLCITSEDMRRAYHAMYARAPLPSSTRSSRKQRRK